MSFIADSLDSDFDISGPVLTHMEPVTTVSSQMNPEEGQNGVTQGQPEAKNGSPSNRFHDVANSPPRTRITSIAYLYSSTSRPLSYSGRPSILWKRDGRSEIFVDSFLFWFDTVEMVRVAGLPSVFYSGWVFPVYILAFLSTLRMIITPHNPLLSSAGFALQDFPFFVLRVALIAVFGFVTPFLYPLKNVLVSLAFIYFTFLTRLKIFRHHSLFWGGVAHSVVDEKATWTVSISTVGLHVWRAASNQQDAGADDGEQHVWIFLASNALKGHSNQSAKIIPNFV